MHAPCAIRLIGVLGGENTIFENHFVLLALAGYRPRPGVGDAQGLGSGAAGAGSGGWALGRRQLVQIHHDIALEPDDLAAAGNPKPVGGQRSIESI